MALTLPNLTMIGLGVHNRKVWHYLTADALATVNSEGYFDAAAEALETGDLIFVVSMDSASAPTALAAASLVAVNANAGGVVDVTDGLAIPTTDTD